MPIIDFRLRPKTEAFASFAENPIYKAALALRPNKIKAVPLAQTIREMDEVGITLGVVSGRDLETTWQWKVENDHVAEIVRQYPDRFIGYCGVDPNKGMAAVREVERSVRELGLRGVSIDPCMQQIDANDKKCYLVYAKAAELGVPVIITTGPHTMIAHSVMEQAGPAAIDEIARDFPELTIIAGHGCYPYVTEMIGLAMRHRNVYFDMSSYERHPGARLYYEAANGMLSHKVIYGSAHPFNEFRDHIKRYPRTDFTEQAWDAIMYRNAARLLGLQLD